MRLDVPSCARGLAVAVCLFAAATADAQQRQLSVETIYGESRADFSGTPPTDLAWLDGEHYLWPRRADNGRGREWLKVEADTGRTSPFFHAERMEAALLELPGVTREEASLLSRASTLTFNASHTRVLLTIADDLYVYDIPSTAATRLTFTPGAEEEATFSPNGQFVAFVRANNLYVVEVATQRERAITTDGTEELLNGKLDWVYQEEIYGRGRFRAYWWSPDSNRLAYLQLNERGVPTYTIVDDISYHPVVEVMRYPKAGDPNPTVKLVSARVAGGEPQPIDLAAYAALEFLIVDVAWTPDSAQIVYQVQDREQTWLDLNVADPANGRARRVLRETTKAWVNNLGNPEWLRDGSFVWQSERSGFRHLYHYDLEGTERRQITSGRWDVRTLYGVDEASGSIYFAGTERSSIGTDVYRVKLDGAGLTRLSGPAGTHRATFNPGFTRYVGVWSDLNTPTQVRLHRADGSELRVIDANPVKALAEYRLSTPELLQVKARDGFLMEALMIRPPDFDPSRRYPVFQHTYAGPGASQVVNRWGGQTYLFYQLLAQHGFVVWILDNRSASGKGVESQWPVYGQLGVVELQDLEDGVDWLKKQPYVDGSRILIEGWSYGGFMASYALTHSSSFAAGIVGAPVTDWRNYDSIYTERYMRLPQNNRGGYVTTAPARAAARLQARMLLLHGTIDDNVHPQNSMQLAYELQKAGKPFEAMFYPKSRHGITDPRLQVHLRQTMLDFALRTIGQKTAGTQTQTAPR
jgi:dipeptidyl-peptidase 4